MSQVKNSEKWYEGLSGTDFWGKHVKVRMVNGAIVYGPVLECDTQVDIDLCGDSVTVLERENADSDWNTSLCVESIDMVWDMRDWEPVDGHGTKDFRLDEYAIVAAGNLYRVKYQLDDLSFLVESSDVAIPKKCVSCILKRKGNAPSEPGFYHAKETNDRFCKTNDGFWWVIGTDGMNRLSTPPSGVGALTKMHFVDDEAES